MADQEEDLVPVSVDILIDIQKKIISQELKIDSCITDHYTGKFNLVDDDVVIVLELKLSILLIKTFLDELLRELHPEAVETAFLAPFEIETMATIVRSVDLAFHGPFALGLNFLEH